ncbi:CHAP domain protein [Coriobacteriaceae bacterium BV3Ac1]|nr:CHAP domain protein [Coriobacteriaceae bacterium BV3Ac1]
MYKGLLRWNATKDYSYFGNDGAMVLNRFITPTAHKTYYFNNKGRSLRWLQTINQRKYYFNAAYLMHTGWLRWNADDTFSYFETNPSSTDYGAMYKGSRIVNGVSYDFGDKGKIDLSAPSRIISIAKKELGTTSGIKYWNYVYGGGYQDATSTPWCACFVSWVLNQSRAYLPGTPSGACTAIMNQSRAAGYEVSLKYVLPGDVLIFNWNGNDDFGDHIGIVESGKNGIFQTIEGNTLNGRVAQRTRYATQIIAVLRPRAKR